MEMTWRADRTGRSGVLALAGILLAGPALAQGFGSLTHNGVEMKVKAVVAVWNPKEPGVDLTLLPYVPTAEEIKTIQSGKLLIFMHQGKPSPDPKKWPDWVPYARYRLSWSFAKEAVGSYDQASVYLYAFGIGENGSNLNLNALPGKYQGSLTGAVKPGGAIELVSKGQDTLGMDGQDKLTWDLKLKATVLDTPAK